MKVLRSRKIVPNKAPKTKLKIEPSTPTQTHESSTLQSPNPPMSNSSSLSPNPSTSPNPNPGSIGLGSDSVSVSRVIRRRSLRLALKPDSGLNLLSDGPRRRKRNTSACSSAEETDGGVLGLGLVGNGEMGFGLIGVRVLEEKEGVVELEMGSAVDSVSGNGLGLGEEDKVEDEGKSVRSLGEFGLGSDMESIGPKRDVAKGKRKLSVGVNLFGGYGGENEESNGVLNLRSGKRVLKREMGGVGSGGDKLVDEREGKEEEQEDNGELVKEISDVENGNASVNRERRFKREDKGKAKLLNDALVSKGVEVVEMGLEQDAGNLSDNVAENDGSKMVNERKGRGGNRKGKRKLGGASDGGVVIENVEKGASGDENGGVKGRRRFSRQEKGKGKLVNDSLLSNSDGKLKLGIGMESKVNNSVDDVVLSTVDAVDNLVLQDEMKVRKANTRDKDSNRRDYMERFRDIARENASRFALFVPQEEEENHAPPQAEVEREIEDWPGPFSTAMKIIKDRETKNQRVVNSSLDRSKPALVKWVPRYSPNRSKRLVPSLKELSLTILAKNADAIVSLEIVPDALRHQLSQLLCDSRRMNSHFFELLVHGSPTEVRLRDCSWLTEEQFTKSFQGCDTSNLTVLQLDQCGRCMPDYIILSTLARSSNSLPALTTLSLAGACRLSDVGLGKLVCAIPAVRSLNLSQCSLLTSSGIDTLADSLGSVLRELYLTDCQGIDPMLILPALKKLGQLQVLSLAGIQNVCDDFVGEFVTARGHNLKELVLTDCVKLTDSSLKVIAENCPGLSALDIMNLCKLTDSAIGYLANGCRAIQTLKLCRNAFSDEAFAAFLETSGESLQELSLNNVRKVGNNTAISLARRSRKLHILDLSWCRNLSDEAMGLIVDNCLSLRVLKLFGCTQITNVFLDGHSNPEVQIIGLKMSPVLEHVKLPDP